MKDRAHLAPAAQFCIKNRRTKDATFHVFDLHFILVEHYADTLEKVKVAGKSCAVPLDLLLHPTLIQCLLP